MSKLIQGLYLKLQPLLKRLLGAELDEKITDYVLKGSLGSFGLQLLATALAFLITIVIARVAGAEEFGIYTEVFSWLMVLSILATVGADDLLMRELPKLNDEKNGPVVRHLIVWANKVTFIASIVIGVLFYTILNLGWIPPLTPYLYFFNIALITIPFYALTYINQAALKGLQHVISGQLVEKLTKPLALLTFLIVVWIIGQHLDDELLIYLNSGALLIGMLVSYYILYKKAGNWLRSPSQKYDIPIPWLKSAFIFTFLSLLQVLATRIDILILGMFKDPEELAYYNVALKSSELLVIPSAVMNTVNAPLYPTFVYKQNWKGMQSLYTNTTRILFSLTLVGGIIFILYGYWLLKGIYGPGFELGYSALVILCVGQILNAFIGPIGYLLILTGYEKQAFVCQAIAVLFMTIAHVVLIPLMGISGAAYAAAGGYFLYQILLAIVSYQKLNLKTGIF